MALSFLSTRLAVRVRCREVAEHCVALSAAHSLLGLAGVYTCQAVLPDATNGRTYYSVASISAKRRTSTVALIFFNFAATKDTVGQHAICGSDVHSDLTVMPVACSSGNPDCHGPA